MEISNLMVKDGHKVIVVTENHDWKDTEEKDGIKIYRIPVGKSVWFKKFRIWWWLWNHQDLIKKADIVHCHDVFFWYLPFRFLYPRKKIFTTFHGYETQEKVSTRAEIMRKISEILSNGNICVGDFIAKWYGTKPDFVIFGGVNTKNYVEYKPPKEPIKIAFAGRLEKDTGVHVYLKALDQLDEKKIKYQFFAYGDGSMKKYIEPYGETFGFVENVSDKIKYVDLVFASSYLTILEAMSLKKPVFAVDQNVLKRDYLEMTPFKDWIVIEDRPSKLAEYIVDYIQKPKDFMNAIEEAYDWTRTQSWDKIKNIYYQLWKK